MGAGSAGTGKSRTTRAIVKRRRQRARAAGKGEYETSNNCVLAAPTGCASFQMKFGAATIHRIFGVPVGFCGPVKDKHGNENFQKRLRRMKLATLFVLDEFSMIGRQMLGKIVFKVAEAESPVLWMRQYSKRRRPWTLDKICQAPAGS